MIAGRPISSTNPRASSRLVTVREFGMRSPAPSTTARNAPRSSARLITARDAPISSMPCRSSTPSSESRHAQFRAVWPPTVESRASIGVPRLASSTMIFSTACGVIGSMYVRSEKAGSVMIVAGFEFTRTMRYPSDSRALHACVPE